MLGDRKDTRRDGMVLITPIGGYGGGRGVSRKSSRFGLEGNYSGQGRFFRGLSPLMKLSWVPVPYALNLSKDFVSASLVGFVIGTRQELNNTSWARERKK